MKAEGARSFRESSARLVFESVLIVLSVLLAFAVAEWRDRAADRNLAAAAVENVRREIAATLAELERVQPKHAQFAERGRPRRISQAVTTAAGASV